MDHDSSDTPKDTLKDTPQVPVPPTERRGVRPASANADLPPQDPALEEFDAAASGAEEDDEGLPEVSDESGEALPSGLASAARVAEAASRRMRSPSPESDP